MQLSHNGNLNSNGKMKVIEVLVAILMLGLGTIFGRISVTSKIEANAREIQTNTTSIAVIQKDIEGIRDGITDIKEILRERR